jgi:hypothetical protein
MGNNYIHTTNISPDMVHKFIHGHSGNKEHIDRDRFGTYYNPIQEYEKYATSNTASKIKIIENNYKKNNLDQNNNHNENLPIQITCEYCDSKLEITKEDTYIGWLGARFVKCPCCEQETAVNELDGITLTINNIKFPVHFHRINKNMIGVKEISTEEIVQCIKHGVEYFRRHKDEYSWYTSFGDLFLILYRYSGDGEYDVMVTKDFYQTSIPFEECDYK